MAVAYTTVLSLLGKQVSFVKEYKVQLKDGTFITFSDSYLGVVTDIVLSITSESQFSIGEDFYRISDLIDFKIL
ncbi:MAG: hypothetical protein L0G96_11805 [Acinetobacter sp.]|nr:hypothetical protein [Acinetobacter sp.]